MKHTLLTGMTPTGYLHLGNYIGSIQPTIEAYNGGTYHKAMILIADYHSLTKLCLSTDRIKYINHTVAIWLTFNDNQNDLIIFRQSDIEAILHLNWIINSLVTINQLKRCHAFKAQKDHNISMSLFSYPILMAADILALNTSVIPVGPDQLQHIELARDVAKRFNQLVHHEVFQVPEALISHIELLKGTDGRKMSKSYHNTIPIITDEANLRKMIFGLMTNSQSIEEPKDHRICTLFNLYSKFASEAEIREMADQYQSGIGWRCVKEELFRVINNFMVPVRAKYLSIVQNQELINSVLAAGKEQTKLISSEVLLRVKKYLNL